MPKMALAGWGTICPPRCLARDEAGPLQNGCDEDQGNRLGRFGQQQRVDPEEGPLPPEPGPQFVLVRHWAKRTLVNDGGQHPPEESGLTGLAGSHPEPER